MLEKTRGHTRKLVVFLGVVLGSLTLIALVNRTVNDQASALSAEGNAKLLEALERLHGDPDRLSMAMIANCGQERSLRRVNSHIIDPPDVVVLGQSDADHMSGEFFRDDVRFYNSFISNSYFAYHYEALEELLERGTPKLVLYDVRSGYLLKEGDEPDYAVPADDPVWWCGAPKTTKLPSFSIAELESLLSVAQTQLTVETFWRGTRWGNVHTRAGELEEETYEQYRVALAARPWWMDRWLADGSRVYLLEHDAIIVPRGQQSPEEQQGERRLNEPRLKMLETYVRKMSSRVPALILYSPPVGPAVLEDGSQQVYIREFDERVKQMATRLHLDYCDLSLQGSAIDCKPEDFFDEIHFSRRCNGKVLQRLATGCAPIAGDVLAKLLKPSALEP
jgi:hypothetical protein